MNWLFEPGVPNELVEDIYMHTLPLAIFAAIQGAPKARVTWPHDDEIAARVVTAAAPLSPVERAEERLDVPRVPGFEPVPDSAKSPRNPAFVGKTEGLCGSERVRKRLTERETAGSTAGSGQPSGTSTAESFLRRVGRRSVGNRPRFGEIRPTPRRANLTRTISLTRCGGWLCPRSVKWWTGCPGGDINGDPFAVVNEDVYEGTEGLSVTIDGDPTTPAGLVQFAYPDGTTCEPSCATTPAYPVTITDEEDRPELSLVADPASIAEEDDSATTNIAENVSTLAVSATNAKTFATDQVITLTFRTVIDINLPTSSG